MDFNFAYTSLDVTTEVNRLPNTFGLLNALGIAPIEPLSSRNVRIDFRDGFVYVLSAEEPGSPPSIGPDESEGGVIMEIPHFPHFENISVNDVENRLQVVNGQVTPRSLDRELARKLKLIRTHHSITLEFIRLGMLRGLIKDGKGKTLHDLFSLFGITKKTVDFKLGTAGTDVRAKCEEVVDHVHTNLKGESTSGVECIISPVLFTKLIAHANVEKFWLNAQNTDEHRMLRRQASGGNWGRAFEFGDIVFREYKGSLPVKNAAGQIAQEKNVADGLGHCYPAGTQNMMTTFEAPVHHIDYVNEEPDTDTIFVSVKELDHGEGIEMKSQSNRLAVCKQPETLVEISSSD